MAVLSAGDLLFSQGAAPLLDAHEVRLEDLLSVADEAALLFEGLLGQAQDQSLQGEVEHQLEDAGGRRHTPDRLVHAG